MGPRLYSPDELNFSLRKFLATHHLPTKAQALREAGQVLTHPVQILENPLLAENHFLKQEALVVSDAFEAATNGMENPEAVAALDLIPPESLFYPWRLLIRSILALYAGDSPGCLEAAGEISEESPLRALVPVLKALAGSRNSALDRRGKDLVRTMEDHKDSLAAQIGQVHEALVTGMEEVFLSLFPPVLEQLALEDETAAARLTLWTLRQLEKYDLDYQTLFRQITQFWGQAEGCRLISLGIYPVDPEAAVLYWMGFLKELPQDHLHIQDALGLLEKMVAGVQAYQAAQGEGEGFLEDFRLVYPQLTAQHPGAARIALPEGWAREAVGTPDQRPQVQRKIRNQEKAPVQLDFFELFAS